MSRQSRSCRYHCHCSDETCVGVPDGCDGSRRSATHARRTPTPAGHQRTRDGSSEASHLGPESFQDPEAPTRHQGSPPKRRPRSSEALPRKKSCCCGCSSCCSSCSHPQTSEDSYSIFLGLYFLCLRVNRLVARLVDLLPPFFVAPALISARIVLTSALTLEGSLPTDV